MNMRVNPGGIMNETTGGIGQFADPLSLRQNHKDDDSASGPTLEKSNLLQYGGASGNTSEKASISSLSSDYKSLIDSLIKQGQEALTTLKEQSSSTGCSDNRHTAYAASQTSQLQALLDSITKLIKQRQERQQSSSSNSSTGDAQLNNVISRLTALLSSLGSNVASGTTATTSTAASSSEGSSTQAMPKDEKDTSVPPSSNTLFKNMDGDNRSADQIINDNPVLKNLGNQKDIKQEDLKKQFGDWTSNNPDEKSRALAAKNMSYFLNNVKSLKNREGGDRGNIATNGKIEGITKNGDARHGTEAAIVKDVAEQGLDNAFPKDGKLTQTNDEMVNLNGTNKSGFQGICLKLGKALAFLPLVSNVLTGMGKSESTNPWDVIKGGLKGYIKTPIDGLKGIAEGLIRGKVTPMQLMMSAIKGAESNSYVAQDLKSDVKDKIKDIF